MANVWMLLIAVVATVAICYQHAGSALAFGWALVHGAGPGAVLAFLPLAAGLALLWAGYVFIRRRSWQRKPVVFAAHAAAIVLLSELLLPGTAREASAIQETLRGVRVSNIRDEIVLSAAGNPIGVRLTFEAVVPETGSYAVSASALQPEGGYRQYVFQWGRVIRDSIEPAPVGGDLRQGVVYTFSKVYLPNFLSYDERTAQPCFDTSVMYGVREEPFLSTASRATAIRLRTAIHVGREEATQSVIAAEYVTGRTYDLGAFHRTVVTEGNRRCGS